LSLSGTFDGVTRVITGTGFGTKATAAPIVFDDFDSGSVNANWGYDYSQDDYQTVVTDVKHNGGYALEGEYAVGSGSSGCYAGAFNSYAGSGYNQYWYVSFWFRKNFTWGTAGDVKFGNYKLNRFNNNSDSTNCYVELAAGDNAKRTIEYGSGTKYWSFNRDSNIPSNTWVFLQTWWKVGDNSDGAMGFSCNSNVVFNETGLDFGARTTLDEQIYGFYNARGQSTFAGEKVWIDEMYVDKSWARVIIGDQPVYLNCTKYAMQIPSAWADTEITVTLNQGSFTGAENMYLFVVDSTGAVSDGLLITGDAGIEEGDDDNTPPSIGGFNPSNGATGVAVDTSIVFVVSDGASGIDLDSLTLSNAVSVNNVSMVSGLSTTGNKSSVTCTLDNADLGNFEQGETVTVGVNIKDLSENSVLTTWDFTTEDNTFRQNAETITLNGQTLELK
jgi:hypothetical protein